MENKKEELINILLEIKDDWPIAKGLILLIERTDNEKNQIELLLDLFENLLKETKNKINNDKLLQGVEKLKKIKQMEQEEKDKDNNNIDLIFNKNNIW